MIDFGSCLGVLCSFFPVLSFEGFVWRVWFGALFFRNHVLLFLPYRNRSSPLCGSTASAADLYVLYGSSNRSPSWLLFFGLFGKLHLSSLPEQGQTTRRSSMRLPSQPIKVHLGYDGCLQSLSPLYGSMLSQRLFRHHRFRNGWEAMA